MWISEKKLLPFLWNKRNVNSLNKVLNFNFFYTRVVETKEAHLPHYFPTPPSTSPLHSTSLPSKTLQYILELTGPLSALYSQKRVKITIFNSGMMKQHFIFLIINLTPKPWTVVTVLRFNLGEGVVERR